MATIAEKLYVTIQYREDTNNEDGLLGFASPYTKDKAFEKRKDTQDSWAYGRGITVDISDEDVVTVTGGGTRSGYGRKEKWDAGMLFIANCYPRVLKNEPVDGFQIAKSVRRYGWGGGGNVKWRITDPRGFDLEISSENFASVLSCSTMVNGVIQGKCVWGREGANNILLPETSEPYQAATALTKKTNTKISLKDVSPGDTVEILSTKVADADQVCVYYGKYFFLESEQITSSDDRYSTGEFVFDKTQQERYLFKSVANNTYFVLATPKIVGILDKLDTPLDKTTLAAKVNSELSRQVTVDDTNNLILISPTKIDMSSVTTSLEPIVESMNEWPRVSSYWIDPMVCELDGEYYISAKRDSDYDSVTHRRSFIPQLAKVSVDALNKNRISVQYTHLTHGSGYWARHTQEKIVREDFDIATIKKFRLVVRANGFEGKVYRLGYY